MMKYPDTIFQSSFEKKLFYAQILSFIEIEEGPIFER